MAKRWTPEEDEFLMAYAFALDAGFLAEHDLGRTASAGKARWKMLIKSGAAVDFYESKMFQVSWKQAAGYMSCEGGISAHEGWRKMRAQARAEQLA